MRRVTSTPPTHDNNIDANVRRSTLRSSSESVESRRNSLVCVVVFDFFLVVMLLFCVLLFEISSYVLLMWTISYGIVVDFV